MAAGTLGFSETSAELNTGVVKDPGSGARLPDI